uniref:Uncharacterized protein n=1 Tax=Branchiostoma floridae TaxID=7739 RepID=C3YFA8_BRAFL|eukprot:XP_002604861.1 hypothetical protein BRAFLDRAFT_121655 [Branchiostoma floridae]
MASVRFAVSSVKEDEDGISNEPVAASSPSESSAPLSPVSPPPRIEIVEYGREPHTYQKVSDVKSHPMMERQDEEEFLQEFLQEAFFLQEFLQEAFFLQECCRHSCRNSCKRKVNSCRKNVSCRNFCRNGLDNDRKHSLCI